jgi:hypothetical protein
MSEELYQVLYVKEGEEVLTEPESNTEVTKRAKRMDEDGYQVLAVMTQEGARNHMAKKAMAAEKDGKSPFFPVQQYQKAMRDVEPEVDDSLDMPVRATSKAAPVAPVATDPQEPNERFLRRHTAVELALAMFNNANNNRSARELVDDAKTILEFLEN